jgi:hypothetical protein
MTSQHFPPPSPAATPPPLGGGIYLAVLTKEKRRGSKLPRRSALYLSRRIATIRRARVKIPDFDVSERLQVASQAPAFTRTPSPSTDRSTAWSKGAGRRSTLYPPPRTISAEITVLEFVVCSGRRQRRSLTNWAPSRRSGHPRAGVQVLSFKQSFKQEQGSKRHGRDQRRHRSFRRRRHRRRHAELAAGQRAVGRRARGPEERVRRRHRRPGRQGHRADLRGQDLHRRRRHHRVRQGHDRPVAAGRPERHRELAQAGDRRDPRHGAGRRPGSGAGRPLSRRRALGQGGPARGEHRPAAGRRRHPAPAAHRRRREGAGDGHQRPARAGQSRAGHGSVRRTGRGGQSARRGDRLRQDVCWPRTAR